MRMSDIITARIIELLDESEENMAEIQRNELAALLGCVPSQINYVLSSRFTPEQGYMIESKRGGGGFIRITRVHLNRSSALMHIVNSIGNSLNEVTLRVLLENCRHSGLITPQAESIMYAAVSANVMREVPYELRDRLRASLIKQMLVAQI